MPEIFDSAHKKKNYRHVDEYSQILKQETPSSNPLNAFLAKPENFQFDAQHSEEKVLLVLRQHPFTQIKWVIGAVILILLPYLFTYVGVFGFLSARLHSLVGVGWYMMVLGYCLEAFLNWYYNVYIITDERVIDVDFSLMFKNSSYARLDKIEDISSTTSGTFGAIFDYGTVRVQTAAAVAELEFEHVPFPTKIVSLLNELQVEEEREKLEGRVN